MRLSLNPEIDILWSDNKTLVITKSNKMFLTVTDLPIDLKHIMTSCVGIDNLNDIYEKLNIDERKFEELNKALRYLIEQGVLINQTKLHLQSEKLSKSYVKIIGLNTFAYEVAHLLALAGVGRIVFQSLLKKQHQVCLGDLNILGPKGNVTGQSLNHSLRESIINLGAKVDQPANDQSPDLVILCEDLEAKEINELLVKKISHVFIGKTGEEINVGPFVIPGEQTCSHCLEINNTSRNIFMFPKDLKKSKPRAIEKNPITTLLATSLLSANCLSYLSGELLGQAPSLQNLICDIDSCGPEIRFRKLQPNPQCGCRWEAA